jgi:glycosyltransferase involved in cell wall biosynthesis
LVTDELDVGGAGEIVALLARRLPALGLSTSVFFTTSGVRAPRTVTELEREGIEVTQVDRSSAVALLSGRRPEVISAHEAPAWWIDLASEFEIPYVETLQGMHAFFDAPWLAEDIESRNAAEAVRSRKIASVIAVSELVRQQYLAVNREIEPARVVTVPNSIEISRVPRLDPARCREWLGLHRDQFLFVSLARYSQQKNTYGLIAAFDEVAAVYPEAHLLVAGRPDSGTYPYHVRELRNALSCRARVHLRDHAPWPAAPLAAANAFVLDSFFEGWSLASMEALYAGVPVVLSDVGGAREQVGNEGERGWLVGNPVGDRLAVDWRSIEAALYARQPNRDELVKAMCATIERRDYWASRRSELRSESGDRFHPDHAVRGHAAVIRRAAARD